MGCALRHLCPPNQVHCTTRVSAEVAETVLHIDGHAYRCEVGLVRCASAHATELGYQPIDDTWCADYRWGNLSPVDQMPRDSIGPAYRVLRFHVLPAVVAWLYTDDAGALLHEATPTGALLANAAPTRPSERSSRPGRSSSRSAARSQRVS